MHPYFLFKDLVTVRARLLALALIVFYSPNVLGHSDNYIPANPRATPASIGKIFNYLIMIYNILIFNLFRTELFELPESMARDPPHFSYLVTYFLFTKNFNRPIALGNRINRRISMTNVKFKLTPLNPSGFVGAIDEKSGLVLVNGQKITMTKIELMDLLNINKENNSNKSINYLEFQSLVNGIFQAEGHWGGYFESLKTVSFRPIWFISQNASTEAIEFFGTLYNVLKGPLSYQLEVVDSGFWHIRLQCRQWDHLQTVIFPYFNQLYGPKYFGMLYLQKIYSLLALGSSPQDSDKNLKPKSDQRVESKVRLIYLAYNITTAGKRKVDMFSKIKYVTGLELNEKNILDYLKFKPFASEIFGPKLVNHRPINRLWVLGFRLGDGHIYIRIRNNLNGRRFIPIFGISQKNRTLNEELFKEMVIFFNKLEIKSMIRKSSPNLTFIVEGKVNTTILREYLNNYSHFYYWKTPQFNKLNIILKCLNLNTRGWPELYLKMLNSIYNLENKRKFDLED